MNALKGLHHVTAITSSAEKIYDFFTFVLGLRLLRLPRLKTQALNLTI
ncbi:catechol 2,3-dioxygenase-like lactoylglutathione lyase family enzyme [Robertmurraya andreesenii]|uniref:Catechol 2,3-dioxygenase-like lactoylglutathione lyase family enzyme n=1 Tax=Anoxybacillus andreesenii TaxID=1325932 RepID=A0ABT9VAS4_9BACL|nr:catechol 2,3-dioxygenase-like lactoylglutathione lyase family enzyme [Robertmurraya andreesenii]